MNSGRVHRQFGKYSLLERIGSGGMAEIWRASLKGVDGFEKILVLKKILPRYARNRSFVTMFVQEAKVCSGLQHANIVQIYELGEEAGDYYIAMEYVNGLDLLKVLTRVTRAGRRVPTELCLFIMAEVCKGLAYAHAATDAAGKKLNIVHLDVSPSNILISQDGEVKITDFGVARATVEGQATAGSDRLKGKLGYMSPEQVTGKPIDHRTDLFSIGIIMYEMFTLKRLFFGKNDLETLTNIRDSDIEPRLAKHAHIPPAVADIMRKALSRTVDTRYQTASEIEEAISHYLFDERLRVTRQSLSAFMRELMELKDEPEGDPPALEIGPGTPTSSAAARPPEPRRESVTQVNVPTPRATGPQEIEHSVFEFRNTDGAVFGPITYSNLVNLVKTRAVTSDEDVRVNGADWVSVRDLPALGRFFPPGPTGEQAVPTESGPFLASNTGRLLLRLLHEQRTGRLKVVRGTHRKDVYLRRGKPFHIISNAKTELLGAVLRGMSLVTAEQLEAGVRDIRERGGPLGDALLRVGAIDQAALYRGLETQFREKFLGLFSPRPAVFEYYDGQTPGPEVVPFTLDPIAAVAEGMRRFDLKTLEELAAPILSRIVRVAPEPPFDAGRLRLTPRETRCRTAIEGRPAQLSALLAAADTRPDERQCLLFVVLLLSQSEHIRIA